MYLIIINLLRDFFR